jgi:predicted glycosyltransferase involved in capsule biosynthesis
MTQLSLIVTVLDSHEVVRRQLLHLERVLPDSCELILVDDGSDPPLQAGCDSVDKTFVFRLHCTHDHRPWTQPKARNVGAGLARSDRLLFFDVDHIVTRGVLRACLDYVGDKLHWTRRPGVLDEEGTVVTDRQVLLAHGLKEDAPSVHPNSFLIRAELFRRLGGYDERFCGRYGGDDLDFNGRYDRLCREGQARPAEVRGEGFYYPDPGRTKDLFHPLARDPQGC